MCFAAQSTATRSTGGHLETGTLTFLSESILYSFIFSFVFFYLLYIFSSRVAQVHQFYLVMTSYLISPQALISLSLTHTPTPKSSTSTSAPFSARNTTPSRLKSSPLPSPTPRRMPPRTQSKPYSSRFKIGPSQPHNSKSNPNFNPIYNLKRVTTNSPLIEILIFFRNSYYCLNHCCLIRFWIKTI